MTGVKTLEKKEIQTRIKQGRDLCNAIYKDLVDKIAKDAQIPPEAKVDILHILENETYFYGDFWRKIISGAQVRRINVAFKEQKAALWFKHYTKLLPFFNEPTPTDSPRFHLMTYPVSILFDTNVVGDPTVVVDALPISTERNFYDRKKIAWRINSSVFNNQLMLGYIPSNPVQKYDVYYKCMQHLQEGVYFDRDTARELFFTLLDTPPTIDLHGLTSGFFKWENDPYSVKPTLSKHPAVKFSAFEEGGIENRPHAEQYNPLWRPRGGPTGAPVGIFAGTGGMAELTTFTTGGGGGGTVGTLVLPDEILEEEHYDYLGEEDEED